MKITLIALWLAWPVWETAFAATNAAAIAARMESIIVPSIEFRSARGEDVLEFLLESAKPAEERHLSSFGFIQTNELLITEHTVYTYADGTEVSLPSLTLVYRRISLLSALTNIANELGLGYAFENGTIVFSKEGKRLYEKTVRVPLGPPTENGTRGDPFSAFDGAE